MSIDCLDALGMDYWKIPSGEITNLPYLRKIGEKGERVILSTGMSELHEIDAALRALEQAGTPRSNVMVLHCNTQYPTPMEDVNLRSMEALSTLGAGSIGYSDHTVGIEVPVAAVALGAKVIEKHFTLDKSCQGLDHKASLEPAELAAMVRAIRNIECALGKPGEACFTVRTAEYRSGAKSIVAARHISKGKCFPLKISL